MSYLDIVKSPLFTQKECLLTYEQFLKDKEDIDHDVMFALSSHALPREICRKIWEDRTPVIQRNLIKHNQNFVISVINEFDKILCPELKADLVKYALLAPHSVEDGKIILENVKIEVLSSYSKILTLALVLYVNAFSLYSKGVLRDVLSTLAGIAYSIIYPIYLVKKHYFSAQDSKLQHTYFQHINYNFNVN